MRFVESASATAEPRPAPTTQPVVGDALAQGLRLPLNALRASLETLAAQLGPRNEGQVMLRAILEEVHLLGRNVDKLLDFTKPGAPHPMPCTVEEIARNVRRSLTPAQRDRFSWEPHLGAGQLEVDAPMLTRILAQLIENSFEAGSERVCFVSSRDGQYTRFSITDDADGRFDPEDAAGPFHSTKPNRLGLGLTLVHRDLAAQGGWLEFERTPNGGTRARVTVPNRMVREDAA